MVKLEDFSPWIETDVGFCSVDLIVNKLRETIRDFCAFTRAWVVEDSIVTKPGQKEYDLISPEAESYVHAVTHMEEAGRPIFGKTRAWLDAFDYGWRTRTGDTANFFLTEFGQRKIRVVPIPVDGGHTLSVDFALVPTEKADKISESFMQNYRDALSAGTLARIYAIPGEKWSDKALAKDRANAYRVARAGARIQIETAHGTFPNQVVTPYRTTTR